MVTNNGTTEAPLVQELRSLIQGAQTSKEREMWRAELVLILDPDGPMVPPEGFPKYGAMQHPLNRNFQRNNQPSSKPERNEEHPLPPNQPEPLPPSVL